MRQQAWPDLQKATCNSSYPRRTRNQAASWSTWPSFVADAATLKMPTRKVLRFLCLLAIVLFCSFFLSVGFLFIFFFGSTKENLYNALATTTTTTITAATITLRFNELRHKTTTAATKNIAIAAAATFLFLFFAQLLCLCLCFFLCFFVYFIIITYEADKRTASTMWLENHVHWPRHSYLRASSRLPLCFIFSFSFFVSLCVHFTLMLRVTRKTSVAWLAEAKAIARNKRKLEKECDGHDDNRYPVTSSAAA